MEGFEGRNDEITVSKIKGKILQINIFFEKLVSKKQNGLSSICKFILISERLQFLFQSLH